MVACDLLWLPCDRNYSLLHVHTVLYKFSELGNDPGSKGVPQFVATHHVTGDLL